MNKTLEPNTWIAELAAAEDSLPGGSQPWLKDCRMAALARFHTLGFPTKRWEAWHYTDLRELETVSFEPALGGTPPAKEVESALARLPGGGNFHRLVFVDGRKVRPLSSLHDIPEGVIIGSIGWAIEEHPELVKKHLGSVALYENHPFTALTMAYFRDGLFIYVPKNVKVERPIEAIFLSTTGQNQKAAFYRNLVVAEEGAEVSLVEVWHGKDRQVDLNTVTTEIVAYANSKVRHVKVQEEGHQAYHLSDTKVHQERDSRVESHVLTTGAHVSRNDLGFHLRGENASCLLHGLFVLNGQQKTDNQTLVDHAVPHCDSNEFYKGVLDGVSEGTFTGRVLVQEDAQKTNAEQQNKNLLLSDHAKINSRPQLEIYADDVKCSHGATTGQLDKTALFYLRTRGIGIAKARQILTRAFATEILDGVNIPAVRDHLLPVIDDRLCPGHVLEEVL